MALASRFIHDRTLPTDLRSLAIVTMLCCHEFNAAVAVLVVLPIDECVYPLTSLLFGGKGLAGQPGRYFTFLNCDSEYGLSLETQG